MFLTNMAIQTYNILSECYQFMKFFDPDCSSVRGLRMETDVIYLESITKAGVELELTSI